MALLVTALLLAVSLERLGETASALGSGPFHNCRGFKDKLKRNGILFLGAKHATCNLARQVAFQEVRGVANPKGFTCRERPGHIDSVPIVCSSEVKRVLIVEEG